MKSKLLLALLFQLFIGHTLYATEITYAFRDATLKYSLDTLERKAEVTGYVNCADNLYIPDEIDYNESSYSVTSIGPSSFRGCDIIEYVDLPNNLLTIGDSAFMGCSNLKEIQLPFSVVSLGACAFADCSSLSAFFIGYSLQNLYDNTFANCLDLRYISSKAACPPKVLSSKDNVKMSGKCVLNVKKVYREAYVKAEWWKDFTFMDDDDDKPDASGAPTDIKVYGKGGVVYIAGIPPHLLIQIFDVTGRPVATTMSTGSNQMIQVMRNGYHIVRINKIDKYTVML